MKIHKILAVCLSILLFAASGCGAPGEEKATSSGNISTVSSSLAVSQGDFLSSLPETVSSAESVSSISASSKPICSQQSSSEKASSSPSVSKKEQSDSEWVAYDTNKDGYKLHIRKKDGSVDKVIINNSVIAPCVVGDWVYYLPNLNEINKVKLDGSQIMKVCDIDSVQVYDTETNDYHGISGSTAIMGKYAGGNLIYIFTQSKQAGDTNITPNPPSVYRLDLKQKKLIPVK